MKHNKIKSIYAAILVMAMVLTVSIPASAYTLHYFTNQPTPNFSTTNLDNLYSGSRVWLDRITDDGCFVTSYAMILRSIGCKTAVSLTDIRNNTYGRLDADPFTVTYANTGFADITWDSATSSYISSYTSDPVNTYPTTIVDNFNANYFVVSFQGLTEAEKAAELAFYINAYPQGVGIFLENSTWGKHLIVGTGETYTDNYSTYSTHRRLTEMVQITDPNFTDFDSISELATYKLRTETVENVDLLNSTRTTDSAYESYFTVCDPIDYRTTPGEFELFSNTWAGQSYDISDIQSLRIIY